MHRAHRMHRMMFQLRTSTFPLRDTPRRSEELRLDRRTVPQWPVRAGRQRRPLIEVGRRIKCRGTAWQQLHTWVIFSDFFYNPLLFWTNLPDNDD